MVFIGPPCREFCFGNFKSKNFFVCQKIDFQSIFLDFTGGPKPRYSEDLK